MPNVIIEIWSGVTVYKRTITTNKERTQWKNDVNKKVVYKKDVVICFEIQI